MLKDEIIKVLIESYGDEPEQQAMLNSVADRINDAVMEWLIPQLSESVARAYRMERVKGVEPSTFSLGS